MKYLESAVQRLKIKISNILLRGGLYLVNDKSEMQTMQVIVLAGEIKDNVPHAQEYGLASNCPVDGAGLVVACPNGNRDQMIILTAANPSKRLKNLASGESALYNSVAETYIKLLNDKVTEISAEELRNLGTLTSVGSISSDADVSDAIGSLNQLRQEVAALKQAYNIHTHAAAGTATPPITAVPVPPAV